MAHFLRDQKVPNCSITASRIEELFRLFEQCQSSLVALGVTDSAFSCVIRFDEKGYRVFTIDDLKRQYRQAKQVERIVFSLETGESIRTSRLAGAFIDLRLDEADPPGFLTVSADNQGWVDASFSAIAEVLTKSKAWYGFIRNACVKLLIQVSGVALVFLFSLAVAKKLTPHVAADNPLLFAFIFVFLISANVWGYIQQAAQTAMKKMFPNVEFVREGREHLHWLPQGVILGVIGVMIGYALNGAADILLATTGIFLK